VTAEDKEKLAEELADVYNWVVLLSHDLGIDIESSAIAKIEKNIKKYPVELSKGKAKKYTEL